MLTTLESIFGKNQSNYLISRPAPREAPGNAVSENRSAAVDLKQENTLGRSVLYGGLSALAIAGISICWINAKGMHNPKFGNDLNNLQPKSGLNLDTLVDETAKLKKLIKEDYLAKRQKIIDDMNHFGEFDFEIPFQNGRDLRNKIDTIREQAEPVIENAQKSLEKNRQVIIDKLKKLSSDEEWKELKILRKKLVKTLKTDKSGDARKIAEGKIPMVNDLMTNKIYPEEVENYKKIYGIDSKDTLNLVKKKFSTYEEFLDEYDSIKQIDDSWDLPFMDRRFSHTGGLSFRTLFPEETEKIEICKSVIDSDKAKLEYAKKLYSSYSAKIRELGRNYRTTEGAANLKRNNSLIAALRNSDYS